MRWERAELQGSLALGILPTPLMGSLSTDSFLCPFSGCITVIFNAGGDRRMFLTACVCFCPRMHQMPDKGGKVWGGCWAGGEGSCRWILCRASGASAKLKAFLGFSFSYTVLSPRKALQPFCHFICWSRTPAPVQLQSLSPEVAESDLIYVFFSPPSIL